jgi:16S rRNA (cytosine1402-N4)-methyltransferase
VHKPVLLAEVLGFLNIMPDGVYIDATLGGGGHSIEIARRLESGLLIGVDQDEFAIEQARAALSKFGERVCIVKSNFSRVDYILNGVDSPINGVLMDLGVSSFQLDDAARGFSYMQDGPLDMRMNRSARLSAFEVVNRYDEGNLKYIFLNYGEERWGARIAEFIVKARAKKPIRTSFELVSVIKAAIPKGARRDGPHPAKRVFQAIRIEVNDELGVLERSIENFVRILTPGGRICVITFHSLEDRIVKSTFARLKNPCICPREMPLCACRQLPQVEIITKKPIMPSEAEIRENPRARSAKLRVAQKVG